MRPIPRLLALLILSLSLTAACARRDADSPPVSPLLFDARAVAQADSLILAVPGALTSITVMRDLERFTTPTRALVYYRLPGLDGRPVGDRVDIDAAADTLARFVMQTGVERAYFVGFSTGSAISLEAAKRIATAQPDVALHVAGISTALPAPQPTLAGVRGLFGNVAAAARVGSLNRRDIWLEYYKTLLYGPPAEQSPREQTAAATIADINAPRIVVPDAALARSHGTALLGWTNPGADRLAGVDIALFHGEKDPVFPLRAVKRFADTLPEGATIYPYLGNGHLLLITQPRLFDHVFEHFANGPARPGTPG